MDHLLRGKNMKKIVTIAAVAALATLAACSKGTETVDVPADEAAAASSSADVQLNDDGTVKTASDTPSGAATESATK
jgi:ABC-type glycerol-3-phosphate transport system substrate-binding protein